MPSDIPDFFPDDVLLETQVRDVAKGILASSDMPSEAKTEIADSCVAMVRKLVPEVQTSYHSSVSEPRAEVERTNALILDYHVNVQRPFLTALLFELVRLRILIFTSFHAGS